MTPTPNPARWAGPVIRFIACNLPVLNPETREWDHMCCTAYQFGCEALAALGQAKETARGARSLPHPRLPERLPRWDDICVTVISLAHQRDLLSYRRPDGSEAPEAAAWRGRREGTVVPRPNITAAHGLGPAHAVPEVLQVLECLGLAEDGRWTVAAETLLWRKAVPEWRLNIANDPRFRNAIDRAVTTMPEDIRAELTRLVTISEADVAGNLAQRQADRRDLRTRHGPGRVMALPLTADSVRKGLVFIRRHRLDWLFFENWRLAEGWLRPEKRKRALAIFHDPLTMTMRGAVIARIWPEHPETAQ